MKFIYIYKFRGLWYVQITNQSQSSSRTWEVGTWERAIEFQDTVRRTWGKLDFSHP